MSELTLLAERPLGLLQRGHCVIDAVPLRIVVLPAVTRLMHADRGGVLDVHVKKIISPKPRTRCAIWSNLRGAERARAQRDIGA